MGHSVIGRWFVSALDKIAKQVDEEGGVDTVARIDRALEKYQEKGHINEEEKDEIKGKSTKFTTNARRKRKKLLIFERFPK